MQVEIQLLGQFRVRVDGQELPEDAWSRRDAAALVKVLALEPGRQLHREQLLDRLWPDLSAADAGPRLHKAAHYARRALGGSRSVVLRDEMVSLLPDAEVWVDAPEFEAAAGQALATPGSTAAGAVLDRFGGEPLPADLYADWTTETRERLGLVRDRLLRRAARWEEVLRRDPLDEEAHVEVARVLARRGDLHGALQQLELLDRTLRRELGTGPGPRAERLRTDLVTRLRQADQFTPAEEQQLEQQIRFCRTADGITIGYASSGSGPPLVKAANWLTHLHHDWNSPVWRHWLLALSRRHTLVRYDERGCGLSDWDIPTTSLESWVEDLETVVEAAGLDRFPLLGISQGGPVAILYAARHPERVSRLVIYGGYALGRLKRPETAERERHHDLDLELIRLGWGGGSPAFRQLFSSQFMPDASREVWDAFNELQRLTSSPENAERVLVVNGQIDVTQVAPMVTCPTLVLHARDDQRPPFSQGRLLASLLPDSRFVALESRNHILLPDEPAWPVFVSEVEAFLAEA